jgi:hypothetical protein
MSKRTEWEKGRREYRSSFLLGVKESHPQQSLPVNAGKLLANSWLN